MLQTIKGKVQKGSVKAALFRHICLYCLLKGGPEILAKAIRSNKAIKGISVNKSEVKISQYADDTTFILNGTRESSSATLNTIEKFGGESGLRLNNKKIEAFMMDLINGR